MITFTRCAFMAKQACATCSKVVQKITPPIANNFLKFFFALFAMLALGVGNAWGADVTETITYSDHKGKGTATTGSEYTMNGDKFSIKDSKFYCNTEKTFAQFMANSTITVTPSTGATIKSIVITASSSSYNGFQSSGTFNPSTGSVKKTDNTHITWTGSATSAFTISHTKQIRWTTIEVTYEETTSSGDTPDPTPTKLTAPTGLTVDAITSSGATLSWDAVANASSYVVTIVDGGSLKKDYPVTGTTTTVSDLESSTEYLWTVTAIGDGTNYTKSEESETGEFTTSAPVSGGEGDGEETWILVTDASTLKADDEVIIAASGDNKYALSTTQKSSNRAGTAITKNGNTLVEPSADVQILTLKAGSTSGTFAFYTGTSGYLYAASSSSNQLKTKTTLDVHGSWTISITEGVASIAAKGSSNRNVMQYNYNNGDPLFNCYSSASQTALAIYKKVTSTDEPETPTPNEKYISGKWKLVDDASKLQPGMEVIIASVAENSAIKTMAEQKNNNRGALASVLDGEYLKPAVGTTLITLEVNESYKDLFALKTEDGYLYAASSSNNYLKSQSNTSINAFWEIKITDGEASIVATKSSNHNVLRYNPNNGAPLFSCYASASQKPITIYSKVYDVAATAANGSVSGTGTYYQGNSVTLKATADFDYEFVNWTVDGEVVSTDNPYKFQVTADVELVAKFQEIAPTTEALSGKFSTGKYEYAEFATGNLQYKPSTDTWRFAKQQYQYVGEANINVGDPNYKGWIDMLGWSTNDENNNYGVNPSCNKDLYTGDFKDWGTKMGEGWLTLSDSQWDYLLNKRPNYSKLKQIAMVGEIRGIMLFPDDWTETTVDATDDAELGVKVYKYDLTQWTALEAAGAVFLPAAGRRFGGYGNTYGVDGLTDKGEEYKIQYKTNYFACYWTSTKHSDGEKVSYLFNYAVNGSSYKYSNLNLGWYEYGHAGHSVRLAKVTNTLIQLGSDDNSEVIEANAGKTVNVQVNRTFKANDGYYTLCLPFDLSVEKIGKALQISSITENVAEQGMNVVFTEVEGTLKAGQPYLVLPKDLDNPIFEGVKIVDTEGETTETVSGAGIKITLTGIINGGGKTDGSTEYYVGDHGYLYNGQTDKLGLRAFFTITDDADQPVKVRARVVVGENTTTGVDNSQLPITNIQKVIENGQLIIIRNGEKFNAQGQKL